MSPVLAQSRHSDCRNECPLLSVKQTSQIRGAMSAYDPSRTLAGPFQTSAQYRHQLRDIRAIRRASSEPRYLFTSGGGGFGAKTAVPRTSQNVAPSKACRLTVVLPMPFAKMNCPSIRLEL
jgi:hypothetical protein